MALFPTPTAEDASRPGLFLNKRLVRIVLAAAAACLLVILVAWRSERPPYMPVISLGETIMTKTQPVAPENPRPETFSDFAPVSVSGAAGKSAEELCRSFPKHMLELVQPVLKMGHGEDRAKIEAQLDSVSACFAPEQLLVFSDLDETIRGHDVVDILANLPAQYYNETYNPHIESYRVQREMRHNGTLDKDKEATKRINGWNLDRYKFLPQVERAWLLKPNRPFYFFYETDTYVVWDNVYRFLQTLDPDKPVYLGSPSPGRHDTHRDVKTWFANGGPGYVLSRGAVKKLVQRKSAPQGQYAQPSVTERWMDLVRDECCGDSVLGWALWNVGVPLQGYWPMFNPHPLHGIPYGDAHWCQPVLTLHKTAPKDMVDVWKWEFGQRKSERPMLYADLFGFHHPGQPETLDDWDNGDWDSWSLGEADGVGSASACEQRCADEGACVQWNWRGRDERRCVLMRAIRYGAARKPEKLERRGDGDGEKDEEENKEKEKERWVDFKAGWVRERIEAWRAERTCEVVAWVGPSITRIF